MKQDNVLTIFTRIQQRLHATARSIAGHDHADDILQDAFCKLWTLKNLPLDQHQTEKITSTIVKNISIDYRRRTGRDKSCPQQSETNDSNEQDINELFNDVKKIIELRLSDTQRQVLWMRDYEGFSFEEIAEQMCMTEENARQILSRARKTVRETYKSIN